MWEVGGVAGPRLRVFVGMLVEKQTCPPRSTDEGMPHEPALRKL